VLERVLGPVFNHIAASFIDAFVRRADATATLDTTGGAE
jgi:ribosome-associated toxin RatA of RatAB toxin-antitoxin module